SVGAVWANIPPKHPKITIRHFKTLVSIIAPPELHLGCLILVVQRCSCDFQKNESRFSHWGSDPPHSHRNEFAISSHRHSFSLIQRLPQKRSAQDSIDPVHTARLRRRTHPASARQETDSRIPRRLASPGCERPMAAAWS